MKYCIRDLVIANEVVALEGHLDKYGTPLVSITDLIWAWKTKIWFQNLWAQVRRYWKNMKIKWHEATAYTYRLIKSQCLFIKDLP